MSADAVGPLDLPAVLGVVVHEHVLGEGERVAVVQAVGRGHRHLEAPHVARVAGVLQAVLVALQEELQLKPGEQGFQYFTKSFLFLISLSLQAKRN